MSSLFVRAACLAAVTTFCTSIASAQVSASAAATQKSASKERIAALVRDLGAEDFKAREAAQKELLEIGVPAKSAIEEASKLDDLEVQQRAGVLLAAIAQAEAQELSKSIAKGLLWSAPMEDVQGSPVLVDKTVLAVCGEGLVALSMETGKRLWLADAKNACLAAASGKTALVANNEMVLAVDMKTGKALWKYDDFGGNAPGALLADETTVYVCDGTPKLTAISLADGKQLWKVDSLSTARPMLRTNKAILIAGIAANVPGGARAGLDNTVTAYSVDNGKQLWTTRYPVVVVAMSAGKDVAYILKQGDLSAVDLESGKETWKYKLPETINVYAMRMTINGRQVMGDLGPSAPVLAGGRLFVLLQQNLAGLDIASGEKKVMHELEAANANATGGGTVVRGAVNLAVAAPGFARFGIPVRGQLVIDGKTAYIQRVDVLSAMDLETGKMLWSLNVGSPFAGAGVLSEGVLYFATQAGMQQPGTAGDGQNKGLGLEAGVHALKVRGVK